MKMRVLVKKYKDQQDRKSKGVNLRSELTVDELYEMEREHIDIVEVRDLEQSLAREFELSGAYLSDSPMAPFEYEIRTLANTDIADLRDGLCKIVDRQLVLVGLVDSFREHTIKSGKYEGQLMAFLTIKKDQKSIDCLVFAKQYAKFNEIIEEGKVYLFKGWFRDGSFIANQIQLLSNL
jgi:DNA polymerase III alpha subunit